MAIQLDLFGKWSLIREYGRMGKPGKILAVPYDTEDEAEMALSEQRQKKERKGYL